MALADLTDRLLATASAAGLDDAGVCLAQPWPEMFDLDEWLARQYHGDMWYMEKRRDLRVAPATFFAPALTAVMVVKAYPAPTSEAPGDPGTVSISHHAVGADYHEVMRRALEHLKDVLREAGYRFRAFTDVAPVMEKVLAVRAGLGFSGRNTLLIHPQFGSWVTIGGLFTDAPLVPSTPRADPGCGECRRCIDACPGQALLPEGGIDARRCLSYWTTEVEEMAFPEWVRRALGHRVFGCDTCQEVCPRNRGAKSIPGAAPRHFDIKSLLALGPEGYEERFGHTTMARLGWERFKRNLLAATATPCLTRCTPP